MLQQCQGSSFSDVGASFGRGIESRSPVLRLGRTASHGHNLDLFGKFVSPKDRKTQPIRGGSLDLPSKSNDDRIFVNVSGKVFEFYREELEAYPQSLLAKQTRVGRYYDFDRKDYFFDRSRIAFESIYTFYQYRGALMFPENYPEQLLMDEFYFFGLYDYLEPAEKASLIKPSGLANKVAVPPKYEWQTFLWHLFEHPDRNLYSKVFSIMTLVVIAFSIIIMCLDTVPELGRQQQALSASSNSTKTAKTMRRELFAMETVCIFYFTIEIILRFIVSPIKLHFWFKALNIIDLVAILPYYIILALEDGYSGSAIVALRMFRLFRAFRILKVSRYISGMKVLGQTLREALSDLWMIAFLTVIGTLLFASCVFYFENIWDPVTPFESIPLTLWWAIVTISTIGYGDMAPNTLAGKLVGTMCAISGVLLIAPLLPIVYERWQRYYLLDQDGKRIKAGQKLLREIEKRRAAKEAKAAKRSKKGDKTDGPADKMSDAKSPAQKKTSDAKNPEQKNNSDAKKPEPKASSTVEDNKENEVSSEETKPGDDIVWTTIKRASIKRRESSNNLLKNEAGKTNTPQKGYKRSSDLSRKGKDVKRLPSVTEPSPKTPKSPTVEEVKPIFTFTDEKGVERDWDKPGPSNVIY